MYNRSIVSAEKMPLHISAETMPRYLRRCVSAEMYRGTVSAEKIPQPQYLRRCIAGGTSRRRCTTAALSPRRRCRRTSPRRRCRGMSPAVYTISAGMSPAVHLRGEDGAGFPPPDTQGRRLMVMSCLPRALDIWASRHMTILRYFGVEIPQASKYRAQNCSFLRITS